VFVVSATRAHAQVPVSFTADLGLITRNRGGHEYDARALTGWRWSAGARYVRGRVGGFAEGSLEDLGTLFGRKLSCPIGANGQCMWFPSLRGWNATTGVLVRPTRTLELRGGVGVGRYVTTPDRATALAARVLMADLSVFPVSHVGVALAQRVVWLDRYRGEPLSMQPTTLAIRIR
jgi:hypothetical protein